MTGGVYYPPGGGLAKVLNENRTGRAIAIDRRVGGQPSLIRDGRADIAFWLGDTLADGVRTRRVARAGGRPRGEPRRPLLNYT